MRKKDRYFIIAAFAIALTHLVAMPTMVRSQPGTGYFPNQLIIKLESGQRMSEIRMKSGIDPVQQIQTQLAVFGANTMEPFWKPRRSSLLQLQSTTGLDAQDELNRLYRVHYQAEIDPAILAAKLSMLPGVEYAEPKYIRYLQYTPDDPITNAYLNYHNFISAWDVTRGSQDVVIAIVDSGVDYTNSDLDAKLWTNPNETPNNGIDDDNNGKVDDYLGWDFWDDGGVDGPVIEDNDPIGDGSDHGTHVAGIAAAETDNGNGISSTGFDVRYMAVKAGGRPDDPSTSADESRMIGFGYEGILYAAEQGADVINCSWGGGTFSEAENDIIEIATAMGSLVIGAAGNGGSEGLIFPAAYDNVLSVGSVNTDDQLASYSNFGFTLDVLATGTSIESTVFSDRIEPKTGTSMSTPVVSGLAGLIKSLNPSWTPQRIASQIRASASSVDFSNANELRNKLGTGKVNAFAAVDRILPGIRITSRSFINNDGEKLGLNEDGSLELHLENFGASTSDLTLSLESIGASGISIQNTRRSIGAMATGEQRTITFSMRITESFDPKEVPVFKINFDDNTVNYADFNIIEYDDILYETLAENGAMMSVGSDGTIGFTDPLSNRGGVGFVPRRFNNGTFTELENLLFEGGLILETNDKVFDAVRTSGGNVSRDFQPVEIFRLNSEGELADLEGSASFTFGDENTLQFGTINLTAFAINDPEIRNVVFLKYDITNPSSFLPLNNLYLGLFNDWDIGDDAFNNSVAWSAADSILYLFDEDPASTLPMVAVAHLGPISSALAIENPLASGSDSVDFGIFDGFTDSEKSISLKAGLEKTAASNNDVSAVIASGPFTLNTNATVTAGFVYAFGDDLAELRNQITAARNRNLFEVSETGLALAEQPPATTRLFQNYPNPFNPVTRLRVDLAEPSEVSIKVYDILGRQVATLVEGRLDARTHIFTFDGSNLGSGLYFARMSTGTEMQTIKLLLVK